MWREVLRRAEYLLRRKRFDAELEDEIQFHVESRSEELIQSGMARGAAMAQARREFGGGAVVREETRAAWQFRWLEDLAGDIRYAARSLRRNPAFALTAIACLALGIGANTTIFSIATEVLFSQPSCRDPKSLLHLQIGGNSHSPMREYRFVRDSRIFSGLAGANEEQEMNWRNGDTTSRLFAVRVTDNYFEVIGAPVAIGRPIQSGESDRVVITHQFWQSRMSGDVNVLGRKLELDGRPYTVAGVLPSDHRTLLGFGFSPDMYVPVSDDRTIVAFYARIPEAMTRQAAAARLKATCQELDRTYPDGNHKWANEIQVSAVSGMNHLLGERQLLPMAVFFAMLMVVVGLVLSIACANVASLLLARAASRTHEFAVRLSIGAGRGRLVRQLLAESLLLAACGTAAGVGLDLALTTLLSRVRLPLPIPIQFLIQPDTRLLAYSVAIAMGVALAVGLIPAWQAVRRAIAGSLKQEEHQVGGERWSLRSALVAGQIAVCIVLLCTGLVFMRNLLHATSMNPGFDVEHTIWAYLRVAPGEGSRPERIRGLVDGALKRLSALPGVQSASIARVVPLNDHMTVGTSVRIDGAERTVRVGFNNNYVGAGYFQTMGIPVLHGREFQASDRKGAPPVAIVNENLARQMFGNSDPVGHTISFERDTQIEIVGVARNSKYFTLGEEGAGAYYEPYAQAGTPKQNLHFLVSAHGRPEDLVAPIRATLQQADPLAALEVKPMRQALVFALLPSRAGAAILGSMGLLGLLLASIGLYGVLLYSVSQRIREIGLRVALGASQGNILAIVLGEGAKMMAAGTAAGMTLAVFALRPLAMFLVPEVRPADVSNFAVVGAILWVVALAACLSPALRALRADPVVALRHE
jgi:predicted permease